MYSPATVAYCGLTSSRANGSRADMDPTLLSSNGLSAPTTRCTDRSSNGGDWEERVDLLDGCPGTLATGRESRSVARRSENKCSDPLLGRNEGQTMLLPIVILTLILSPVLIPALATAFHLVARLRNANEFVTVTR
jgi:hypothetical protein